MVIHYSVVSAPPLSKWMLAVLHRGVALTTLHTGLFYHLQYDNSLGTGYEASWDMVELSGSWEGWVRG